MRSKTILSVLAGAALCLTAAGCSSDDNTNTTVNANANRAANANAVATATPAATPAGSAYNHNYNSKEEFNKNANDYRAEAKNKGESVGDSLEDGWIHLKVRAALAAADDLRDSTINVDVDKNVVTLRGTVANAAQKTKAAEVAQKIDGVKSVTNKLEVKAAGSSNANAKSANTNANAKK